MDYLWGYKSIEAETKHRQSQLNKIGERVCQFFWDDAPNSFGFEEREGQQDMAFEILDAIKKNQHIAVEAGVGIGKSFAYLAPLLLYNQSMNKPIAVATSTIALQEQLFQDATLLQKLLHTTQDIMIVKGQSHYLCRQRADAYLMQNEDEICYSISESIDQGCCERKSFPYTIPQHIWEKLNVTKYNKRTCASCSYKCTYHSLRKRLKVANGIVLCNQDLLTAHLLIQKRGQEGVFNPKLDIIVIDEAHNLEDKVRSATTERFKQTSLNSIIIASEKEVRNDQSTAAISGK